MSSIPSYRRHLTLVTTFALLSASVTSAFLPLGVKWPTSQVSYYVNGANMDLNPSAAEAAVRVGAEAWSAQSAAHIDLVYAGTTAGTAVTNNGKNEVFFRNASNGGAIASTYVWNSGSTLLDADIVFWDGAFKFYSGASGCSGGFYIEDIAAHEFGHALGLDHSSTSGATMYYSVSYCSQALRSLASDDIAGIEALYPAVGTPPAAPTSLLPGTPTSSSVSLSWADNSMNEDTFLVERSPDGASSWYQVASTGANARNYTDSGLAASTPYYYRVRASNSAGFSGYTNIAGAATTAPQKPSMPASPAPSNVATNVNTRVTLSWSCSNATSYDVYLGPNGALSLKDTVSGTSLAVSGLPTDTAYSWKVVAKNGTGSTEGPTWTFTTKSAVVKMGKKR